MKPLRLAFALAVSLAWLGVTPGRAASPGAGTLDVTTTSVSWQGVEFKAATYASSGVLPQDQGLLCFDPNHGNQPFSPPNASGPSACDVYTLTVNVDTSYWQSHAGGVTVNLSGWKLNADGATDDIDLYIYKHNADGTTTFVTSSGNPAGQPETATINNPTGTYYIAAVGFAVTDSSYSGTASLSTHSLTPPNVAIPGQPLSRASHDQYISHSEPHIAMNPKNHSHLVAGSKQYVDLPHYRFNIGTYSSLDGGLTWTDNGHLGIGAPGGYVEGDDCDITSDIWLAYDDQGTAYAMVLHDPSVPDTSSSPACPRTGTKTSSAGWNMELWKSADDGKTWTGPVHIHDNFSNLAQRQVLLDDKNAIAIDNYTHAPGQVGTAYACWELDSNPGVLQQLAVAVSNNAGQTWSAPTLVSVGETRELGCQISIAKSGSVVVAYFDYANNKQMFVRSDDHGLTWTRPQSVATVNPLPSPFPGQAFRNQSLPGMAYSAGDDSLYVVWSDYTTHGPVKDADILFSKSSTVGNAGVLTWTAPARVNQDAVGNGKDQFQPAIAITESGQINVSYFDRRNDPDNFFIDTYLSRSSDGGAHWTDARVTQQMSNPQVNPPIDGGRHHFYGDYQGLVADDRTAIPFFNATFLANLPSTDPQYSPWQEVFAGRVPNPLPDLLVSSIAASRNPTNEGDRFTINATVANAGFAPATNIGVRFAVDGTQAGADQSVASLTAGQNATVSIPWDTRARAGTHTVSVTVDPTDTIKELDETNNTARLTFVVRRNRVTNGSFERVSPGTPQPTGWAPNGNVIWDNTGKYATDGAAAAGVVASTLPGQAGSWTSQAIAVTPGAIYSVSASVASATTANPSLLVLPSGSGVTTALAPILNLTQPVDVGVNQLVAQIVIPPGVSDVIIVLTDTTDEATHTVFFDKVGLFGND
jgi:hypothetical protein